MKIETKLFFKDQRSTRTYNAVELLRSRDYSSILSYFKYKIQAEHIVTLCKLYGRIAVFNFSVAILLSSTFNITSGFHPGQNQARKMMTVPL